MRIFVRAIVMAAVAGAGPLTGAAATTVDEAQRLLYRADYEAAAAAALAVRLADSGNLAAFELRSSALHFQIKRALGPLEERERAWKSCTSCPELISAFQTETNLGRGEARSRLKRNPADIEALFFLGKLDLNYVWLQLGTLGRRSGWSEYWEARKSLDTVLRIEPGHVRARVARGLIDYIVDTKVPRGVRWLLGGGNKKRGLQVVRDATLADAPPFVQAEAMFALWDMQIRERNVADAIVTARALARGFPDNRELAKFLYTHDLQSSR